VETEAADSVDIIPTPNAHLSSSQPIFPTLPDQSIGRQSLNYLNEELSKTNGQSITAQRVKQDLKPYLDRDMITDL